MPQVGTPIHVDGDQLENLRFAVPGSDTAELAARAGCRRRGRRCAAPDRRRVRQSDRPQVSTVSGDLAARTRHFVRETVLPHDDEHDGDIEAAGGEALRLQLQRASAQAGLLAPHGPVDCGGLGLGMVERTPVFEAAGYSLFGPLALNIAAPDEGNVHLLAHVATEQQRDRYLRPLVLGHVRSAFAMTEPSPGAGSDPSMLSSRAERSAGGWRINAHKWFITGADGAGFFIVMARTSGEPGSADGATMFLVPADPAGRQGGAARRDHGPVDARRSLRGALRQRRGARGRRPRRRGRGIPLRAGQAGPGPDDPRDALDWRRGARP